MDNNINFTSRVRIANLTKNTDRWKNISKLIEEKTPKLNDYLEISKDYNSADNVVIDAFTTGESDMNNEHVAVIPEKILNRIMKKSDEFIAKKIIKFIKICRHQDKDYETANKFCKKIGAKSDDEFTQKFWDLMVDKGVEDFNRATAKDNILKKFEYK